MVLGIPFLFFSHANIYFDTKKLINKTYPNLKTIFTIKQVELIDKYKFVKATLNKSSQTFLIHLTVLEALESAKITINKLAQLSILQ